MLKKLLILKKKRGEQHDNIEIVTVYNYMEGVVCYYQLIRQLDYMKF